MSKKITYPLEYKEIRKRKIEINPFATLCCTKHTHAQLYVALPRVSSIRNIILNVNIILQNVLKTENVVYREVFT